MPDFEGLERYADLLEKIDAWEGGQADGLARWIMEYLAPQSVIDIGCASGLYLVPFLNAGIRVLGVDGAPTAGQKLPPENYIRHDLRYVFFAPYMFDVWPHVFDVCLCLETAEHIEPPFTNTFVDTVAQSARVIVFSAAQPGQGGEGHFNCQPKQYWLDKFAAYGFHLHPLNDEFQAMVHENEGPTSYYHPWLINNSFIIEKENEKGHEAHKGRSPALE